MREDVAGNTAIDSNESDGLIPPHLTTRAELNQWEARNIASAQSWIAQRNVNVLDVDVLRDLHRRMFGETWDWAGSFRTSDKNISPYQWTQVPMLMLDLVNDTRARYDACGKSAEELDEIALRFHHQLVRVHPWPNGNGRHSRLVTEVLLRQWGRPPFTWGSGSDLNAEGAARAAYIAALRRADRGDLGALQDFVRA